MQNQLQPWSDKALLAQKRCTPWSQKLIVLFTTSSRLLMHMLNSLRSTAIATSNQVNRIIFCLCFFRQFFCPCQRRSCADLNSSKRFHKTKISYRTECDDILYLLQGFFFLGFGSSRKVIQLLEQFLKYSLMTLMVLPPSCRTSPGLPELFLPKVLLLTWI